MKCTWIYFCKSSHLFVVVVVTINNKGHIEYTYRVFVIWIWAANGSSAPKGREEFVCFQREVPLQLLSWEWFIPVANESEAAGKKKKNNTICCGFHKMFFKAKQNPITAEPLLLLASAAQDRRSIQQEWSCFSYYHFHFHVLQWTIWGGCWSHTETSDRWSRPNSWRLKNQDTNVNNMRGKNQTSFQSLQCVPSNITPHAWFMRTTHNKWAASGSYNTSRPTHFTFYLKMKNTTK